MRIVIISQSKGGGTIGHWNRTFMSCFPGAEWWCWTDFPGWKEYDGAPEQQKVLILTKWMVDVGVYTADCPVIADGYWGAPLNTGWSISVAHGIWDHDQGDEKDKFQFQYEFWKDHMSKGRKIIATSDFIRSRFWNRWSWPISCVNTGIDLSEWIPVKERTLEREKPIVLHGITNPGDSDILPGIVSRIGKDFEVLSISDGCKRYGVTPQRMTAEADIILFPAKFDGGSSWVTQGASCGVPIVGYNTGLLWNAPESVGVTVKNYSAASFVDGIRQAYTNREDFNPREWAEKSFSIDAFRKNWTEVLVEAKRISAGPLS